MDKNIVRQLSRHPANPRTLRLPPNLTTKAGEQGHMQMPISRSPKAVRIKRTPQTQNKSALPADTPPICHLKNASREDDIDELMSSIEANWLSLACSSSNGYLFYLGS
ncbi:hypothetical protein KSP39_PZI007379 [Platanthera zijinensis]|uniref:Uncharacterized protein n=1 Tax=Platanthera zijinensis TaxID=2320716 RepID=A0AAP0GA53_9ASPA